MKLVNNKQSLAVFVSAALALGAGGGPLIPQPAPPKMVHQCTAPGNVPNPGPNAQPVAMNANMTGGGAPILGSSATLPAGVMINLTGDLTVVATGNITIQGQINLPDVPRPGLPSPNILLMSLNGSVKIDQNAFVGAGSAATGVDVSVANRPAFAQSGGGSNGGYIELNGAVIEVKGEVEGHWGGTGGSATADAVTVLGRRNQILKRMGLLGDATAVGAQGGYGGDVVLCAKDGILIDSGVTGQPARVTGGNGGYGGFGDAKSDSGAKATAVGGPGNFGGSVVFVGTLPNNRVDIRNTGVVAGGSGGISMKTVAVGGPGGFLGGDAEARGGDAGQGGTIQFFNAEVSQIGTMNAGSGQWGGAANATGGNGGPGIGLAGGGGGNATSTGGKGGAPGRVPSIPRPPGPGGAPVPNVPGGAGATGRGGNAVATPGNGGNGTLLQGGSSGTGTATGGPNGAGTPAAGGIPTTPATPPAGRAGGIGAAASQNGAP